jgi:hypothetical protein
MTALPIPRQGPVVWTYLANATLLFVHEIDSAYWHEWSLFGIPGGAQLFLLLHVPLLALVLDGFRRVVLWRRGARAYSLALAAAGISAFAIHGVFLVSGHPEFRQPVSLGILGALLVVSVVQGGTLLAHQVPTMEASVSDWLAKSRPGLTALPSDGEETR